MRDLFPGFSAYSEPQRKEAWEKGVFVFDANVLLDFYRYTPKVRDVFFQVLEKLKDRIWVPYQAAWEFYDNRSEVIRIGQRAFNKIPELAHKSVQDFAKALGEFQKYQFLGIDQLIEIFTKASDAVSKRLNESSREELPPLGSDKIENRLHELFSGKVGHPPQETEALLRKAEQRLSMRIPPGYSDVQKGDYKKYGDILVWLEILDFAASSTRPVLLITGDTKEDWWRIEEGKTLGPRAELIQEVKLRANVPFYMYRPQQFLKHATKSLGLQELDQAASRELTEIEKTKQEETRELRGTIDRVALEKALAGFTSAAMLGSNPFTIAIRDALVQSEQQQAFRAELARRIREYLESQSENDKKTIKKVENDKSDK